ncbi:MAG: hypothetical protein ACOC1L_01285 [Bacillota bacterium]
MTVYDYFYSAFLVYQTAQPTKRFKAWIAYINQYPALMNFCLLDYIQDGISPRQVGLKKVFTRLVRVDKMIEAYHNIMTILKNKEALSQKIFLHEPLDLDIILYHGLGNGAGTATTLNNRKCLLFGIEKIAALSWQSKARLRALFIHEYAHLLHDFLRTDSIEKTYDNTKDNAYYRLYIEGVATYLEDVVASREVTQTDWYTRCIKNEQLLKQAFLKTLGQDGDVTPYFGDWNPPLNIPESAYFMGMQVVSMMHKTYDIKTIMTLPFTEVKTMINTYFEV